MGQGKTGESAAGMILSAAMMLDWLADKHGIEAVAGPKQSASSAPSTRSTPRASSRWNSWRNVMARLTYCEGGAGRAVTVMRNRFQDGDVTSVQPFARPVECRDLVRSLVWVSLKVCSCLGI
jgi:hypothetical protein